jgi:hypothetical protein
LYRKKKEKSKEIKERKKRFWVLKRRRVVERG